MKIILSLIGALILTNIYSILIPLHVNAVAIADWGDYTLSLNDNSAVFQDNLYCKRETVEVTSLNELNVINVNTYSACVYPGKTFSLAKYKSNSGFQWALKERSDLNFANISNISINEDLRLVFGTDTITFFGPLNGGRSYMALHSMDDASSAFKPISRSGLNQVAEYRFEPEGSKVWFEYFDGARNVNSAVVDSAYSTNGRYMVAWVEYRGYVLVDFVNKSSKAFFYAQTSWYGGPARNYDFGAVSDDGELYFDGRSASVILLDDCGYDYTKELIESGREFYDFSKLCKPLSSFSIAERAGFAGRSEGHYWIDQNQLSFSYRSNIPIGSSYKIYGVKMVFKALDESKLDYLALGDSFSSGEGDVEKQSNGEAYYIKPTQVEGGCHLSSRSYPFLLSRYNNLSEQRMKSVACSGARIKHDYIGSSEFYMGQYGALKSLLTSEAAAAKQTALSSFEPGIVKQIDFIRANKPKSVTVTGGGNDVGFGSILKYCAGISAEHGYPRDCEYALKGSELAGILGSSIRQQYENMRSLIEEIKTVSPDTTVYVVGYPSFVATKLGCINEGLLSFKEASMLDHSVNYLNDSLKQAAKNKGAHYVDIKDALNGGRICEGSTYVTGVNALLRGATPRELFHPNAAGHQKMAEAINGAGFEAVPKNNPESDGDAKEPAVPDYFSGSELSLVEMYDLAVHQVIKKGERLYISAANKFKQDTKAILKIHSKETKLGEVVVDPDGSVEVNVKIPGKVKPGYHIITLTGTGLDGRPLKLYQFVEMVSDKDKDADDDGIKDSQDRCRYIERWYDETSKKDVCKL